MPSIPLPTDPGALASFRAMLDHSAAQGAAPALRFGARSVSHAELAARVRRLAAGLRAHGLARGDRVALLMRNCPELLELFLAAALAGVIVVPLNYRLAPAELRWIVADVEPAMLVLGAGLELDPEVVADLRTPPPVSRSSRGRMPQRGASPTRASLPAPTRRRRRPPHPRTPGPRRS